MIFTRECTWFFCNICSLQLYCCCGCSCYCCWLCYCCTVFVVVIVVVYPGPSQAQLQCVLVGSKHWWKWTGSFWEAWILIRCENKLMTTSKFGWPSWVQSLNHGHASIDVAMRGNHLGPFGYFAWKTAKGHQLFLSLSVAGATCPPHELQWPKMKPFKVLTWRLSLGNQPSRQHGSFAASECLHGWKG